MTISLTRLQIRGLKKGDGKYEFPTEVAIFVGENGSGKTTILQAIHLLLRGRTPKSIGHAATGKDILALSSNGRISIEGTWLSRAPKEPVSSRGGAKFDKVMVKRSWVFNGSKVKEEIKQSIDPSVSGTKEQQGLLNLYFGNIPEIWNPDGFFDLSANKMRAKLLTSVSSRPIKSVLPDLQKTLGDVIPYWANPSSLEMTAETWLQFTIKEADRRIRDEQADMRNLRRQLEEEPAFVRYRKENEVKAELDSLGEKRKEVIANSECISRLSFLQGKKEALLEQVSDMDIEIEVAKAEVEELKESSVSLDDIEKRYREVAEEYKVVGAQSEIEEQRTEFQEALDLAIQEEVKLKGTRTKLKLAEEILLESAKAPFEEAISSVVDKECRIDLSNGGCVIRLDGVDISALSDGETLSLVPGIIAGLARACEAKWLPMPLDRFEAISFERRVPFLRAVKKLIDEGALSQAIIAGCPDNRVIYKIADSSWITVKEMGMENA